MKKRDILPQLMYEFDAPPEILSNTLALAKEEEYEYKGSGYGSRVGLFREEKYEQTFSWINECLEEIRVDQEYNCDELKVCLSWLNKWETGKWSPEHIHGNSFLSGILYLTDNDARTWFSRKDPWNDPFSTITMGSSRIIVHKELTVAGKMVIFPSSLLHSIDENRSNHLRYTLAFNAFPSGNIYANDYAQIKINLV